MTHSISIFCPFCLLSFTSMCQCLQIQRFSMYTIHIHKYIHIGGSKSVAEILKVLNIFYWFLAFQHNNNNNNIYKDTTFDPSHIQMYFRIIHKIYSNSTRTHNTSISGSQFLLIDFNTKCINFEYIYFGNPVKGAISCIIFELILDFNQIVYYCE